MSVTGLVTDGPLLLATPVAAAAGLLSFFSPCVLPLVPGYLSYITGLSGADLEGQPAGRRGRAGSARTAGAVPSDATASDATASDSVPSDAVLPGASAVDITAFQAAPVDAVPVGAALVPAGVGVAEGLVNGPPTGPAPDPGSPCALSAGGSAPTTVSVRSAPGAPAGGSSEGMAARWGSVGQSLVQRVRRIGRVTVGSGLFVLGFGAVFVTYGVLFGGLGSWLRVHQVGEAQVLGALTIVMGLLFAGVFSRFLWANREVRLHRLPTPGLLGAPLLGVMFGLGWTPCIGPTLGAVLGLAAQSATAGRGAFLSAVYCLGLGVPFLIVGLAFRRTAGALAVVRSHARVLTLVGGALLVAVGVLQVTGQWTELVFHLRSLAPGFAETPL